VLDRILECVSDSCNAQDFAFRPGNCFRIGVRVAKNGQVYSDGGFPCWGEVYGFHASPFALAMADSALVIALSVCRSVMRPGACAWSLSSSRLSAESKSGAAAMRRASSGNASPAMKDGANSPRVETISTRRESGRDCSDLRMPQGAGVCCFMFGSHQYPMRRVWFYVRGRPQLREKPRGLVFIAPEGRDSGQRGGTKARREGFRFCLGCVPRPGKSPE
jgi:hypothetical protein